MEKGNNLPKISIIMPVFNGAKYIGKAIESVVRQDYPDFELFIKDGDSTDETVKIIKQYAKKYPRRISWISKKDKGQTDAINYGIKKVTGDIIAYLNADDKYKPGAFKIVGKYFSRHPDKNWVIGKCDIIDSDDKKTRSWITAYKNFWMNFDSYQLLLIMNYISQMSVFWKRQAGQKSGFFDENEHYVMDYKYWLGLYKDSPPGKINKELASFRVSPLSKSSTGFIAQFDDEIRVAKNLTDNNLIIYLHLFHANMVKIIYGLMRRVSFKDQI